MHQALAITYFVNGPFEDSIDAAPHVIDYNSSFSPAYGVLAAALLRVGRVAEAKAAAFDSLSEPDLTIPGFLRVIALEPKVFGPFVQAWRELGRARVIDVPGDAFVPHPEEARSAPLEGQRRPT